MTLPITAPTTCPWLQKTAEFLNEIGIKTVEVDQVQGFLPNCRVVHGALEYSRLCDVGDLLHEAGHLAIMPGQFRDYLDGDVGKGLRRMLDEIQLMDLDPDEKLYRAAIQCSDAEASAWGWAAAHHLGIPVEMRILDHHFSNQGVEQRLSFEMGHHLGVHGLAHAGFCVTRPHLSKYMKRPAFPELLYWLQPVIEKGVMAP